MSKLVNKTKDIRAEAARFYEVDFHMHSPGSHDWNNSGSSSYKRNSLLDKLPIGLEPQDNAIKAYIDECSKSKRKIAIITDHNKFKFAEKAADYDSDNKLIVLPGIELSIAIDQPLIKDYRIHVLAVFPPGTSVGQIQRLFPAGTNDENKRNGKEDFTLKTLDELIKRIHDENGISIAAHIYSSSGIRYAYTESADLVLEPIEGTDEHTETLKRVGDQVKEELFKFDCLQVKKTTKPSHFQDESGELSVALIVGSDCHSAKNLGVEAPEKMTYVKMSKPDFVSLKEAIKFADTRIRSRDNLPKTSPPRVLGVRIFSNAAGENTFFVDIVLGFSDNLTCLIGPRGSGKSATIDAVRYLMGFNRTLDQISKVKEQIMDRQKATLQNCSIELLYQKADGQIHKLQATYDARESYVTKVTDLEDNYLKIDDVEKVKDYPLNLYGWNELELLAENTQTQRELLDRFITVIHSLKEEEKEALLLLNENKIECLKQANYLNTFFENPELDFQRIKEYEHEFNKLNSSEMQTVFKKLDELNQKKKLIELAKAKLNATKDSELLIPIKLSSLIKEISEVKEWADDLINKRLKADELDDWILKEKAQYEGKLKFSIELVESEEEVIINELAETEKEIKETIGEEKAITGDLRNIAKQRFEKAKSNYTKYKLEQDKIEKLFKDRDKMLNSLADTRKKIYATRNQEIKDIEEKVRLVEDEEFKLTLKLRQLGDKRFFLSALRDDSKKPNYHGQYSARKIPEIIAENLKPEELVRAINKNEPDKLVGKYTDDLGNDHDLDKSYAKEFIKNNIASSEIEDLDVKKYNYKNLERLLGLQQIPIDDEFFIELSGKPIQNCSPGQRCSAMLPIVTLTSDAPLIIDQPEDNLDNRLVSRALFKILSKLKETRQIILATHNPNILVSGDAEQVLLLDNKGNLEEYGCIDKSSIIKKVISLMEGGKEAFIKREKKYKQFIHDSSNGTTQYNAIAVK